MHQHHQSFNGCDATDQKKYNTRPDRNPPAAVYEASDPRAANAARVIPEDARIIRSHDCKVGYVHQPAKIGRRFVSKVPFLTRLRVREMTRLFEDRHGGGIDTDDIEFLARPIADHLRHFDEFEARRIFSVLAPTLAASEIAAHLDAAHERKAQWSASRLGEELSLTVEERRRLGIKTFRAKGVSKDQQTAETRDQRNATKRQKRAAVRAAKPRAAPLSETEPWLVEGVSRRTWFRRRAKERGTDGGLNKGLNLGNEAPIAATCSATGVQAEKPVRRNDTHVSAGHRPEPNPVHNHSRPKGETHMADIVFTEAEDASNNAAEACAAARAAGRSDAAIVEAMLALAGRPDIDADTPKGAGFVVAFAASFDASVAKVKAQVADLNSRPEVRGRIGLAARLFEKFDGDVEMTCAVLRDSPRNPASSLAARMATASIEPTVGAPFGATPDPDAGWTKAIDAANRKKALN
jgi:hypothetical protein